MIASMKAPAYYGLHGAAQRTMTSQMRAGPAMFLAWLAVSAAALAQDGAIDLRFASGKGPSDDVYDLARAGAGIWLAGHFTSFDEHERWRLARLKSDGALDETFDPHDSAGSAPVKRVCPLPDGGLLVAGPFNRFDGETHRLVCRLKNDGTLDRAFDANDVFGRSGGDVEALALTPDGKILVAGRFDFPAERGQPTAAVRLSAEGALDESFAPGIRVGSEGDVIKAMTVLPDGKILIGGQFSPSGNLARLAPNGDVDFSFHPKTRDAAAVGAIALQPDGKILAAFGMSLVRLGADGDTDESFHVEHAPAVEADADARIDCLLLQPDGAVLVGGSFHSWGGVRRDGILRLKADGALDRGFDPGAGIAVLPVDDSDETPEAVVHAILPLDGGRLLIAGRFDLYNGAPRHNLVSVFNGPRPGGP